MKKIIMVPSADDGQRLDRWLQNRFPEIPYAMIQKAVRTGEIRVNGKKADSNTRLESEQEIRLPPLFRYAEAGLATESTLSKKEIQSIKEMVLYEDGHLLVLNKPNGIGTQGGTKTRHHIDRLLMAFAKNEDDKPKLVHRLDKETSGVLLVAKTREVAAKLGSLFKERQITKTYLAITVDIPRTHEATISLPLHRLSDRVVVDKEEGKPAVTSYRLLSFNNREMGLVALRPETGRMHQLRAHMAHLRCPILGDKKYGVMVDHGRLAEPSMKRLWLHALAIHFDHPITQKPLSVFAPLPRDWQMMLESWHMTVPTITDTHHPQDPFESGF